MPLVASLRVQDTQCEVECRPEETTDQESTDRPLHDWTTQTTGTISVK